MPHINKQMASFFLTTKCNLRCVYCYNSKERMSYKQQSLPLEIAKVKCPLSSRQPKKQKNV